MECKIVPGGRFYNPAKENKEKTGGKSKDKDWEIHKISSPFPINCQAIAQPIRSARAVCLAFSLAHIRILVNDPKILVA